MKLGTFWVASLLLVGPGCDSILGGCDEQERIVELVGWVPGNRLDSLGYELNRSFLRLYETSGWDCGRTEPVRNAFGTQIGTRYTCTKCE